MRTETNILTDRLNGIIAKRKDTIYETINKIVLLSSQIDDYIGPSDKLVFDRKYLLEGNDAHQGDVGMTLIGMTGTLPMHDNAVIQVGDKLDIPSGYLKGLVRGADWQKSLSTRIMNEHNEHKKSRYLVRAIDGQVRGFLSDRYRILDSSEIFVTFLEVAAVHGFKLIDSHYGEIVQFVEIIKPEVVEIETPNNGIMPAVFGARLRSSEFGAGALELQMYILNVLCMNGAIGESPLRKVHIGARLPEGISLSDETIRKETAARISLMKDAVRYVFDDRTMEKVAAKIRKASATHVDLDEEIKKLPKRGIMKHEADLVMRALLESNPNDGLYGEPTMYKLANAITAVSRDSEPERRREIEIIAGGMMGL